MKTEAEIIELMKKFTLLLHTPDELRPRFLFSDEAKGLLEQRLGHKVSPEAPQMTDDMLIGMIGGLAIVLGGKGPWNQKS